MTAGTLGVYTPAHESRGPAEYQMEQDEDEDDDEDEEYDEIGISQLGGAPLPTQLDEQVLQTTLGHISNKFRDAKY
jgi:hypothetical protein